MTEAIKVQFRDWLCDLVPASYDNGRLALLLIDDEGPVATATVNLPDEPLAEDEVILRTWSENTGILEALVAAGVVEPTGRVCVTGFVEAPVCRMKVAL